ncbi:MAG: hypothetical protein B6I35_08850 [Anaerolineaceae bacterium 4572_32.2]|nr:MAG: hypothetical protein B6I35_08850 [Anaerolineaceae bacterium 4572_32.2]
MADVTVAELFEMAIGAEKAAEELYHGLAAKFAHHPEVADFWKEYAAEEWLRFTIWRTLISWWVNWRIRRPTPFLIFSSPTFPPMQRRRPF